MIRAEKGRRLIAAFCVFAAFTLLQIWVKRRGGWVYGFRGRLAGRSLLLGMEMLPILGARVAWIRLRQSSSVLMKVLLALVTLILLFAALFGVPLILMSFQF